MLLYAQDYEAAELAALLPGIEFKTAIDTLEVISAKTEDKQMVDQREKAQRDYEWALSGARQKGLEQGMEKGMLAGRIQTLQEQMGEPVSTEAALLASETTALIAQNTELQKQLRDRRA